MSDRRAYRKRSWSRPLAIMLAAVLALSSVTIDPGRSAAATNEPLATNNLTVNGETAAWTMNGTWPTTLGDGSSSGGLDYWDNKPIEFTITHEMTGLAPGTYLMTAKTYGDKGEPAAGSVMFATSGGQTNTTPITYAGSAWGSPSTLTLGDVVVGNDGVATLGFTVKSTGEHYGYLDEVTFTRTVPSVRLTVNGAPATWTLSGVKPDSLSDTAYSLNYWDDGAIDFGLAHRVAGLQPGIYTMTAKVYGETAPDTGSTMYAVGGGQTFSTPIAYDGSGWQNGASVPTFRTLTMDGVEVGADGIATIGFAVKSAASNWGHFADVTFEPSTNVGKLKTKPASANLRPERTQQIAFELPQGTVANVTYASDNPAVATVDANGLVTAAGNGQTTIHVTLDTEDGRQLKGKTDIFVSGTMQRLASAPVYAKPVPELQDGKREDFIMGADISTVLEMQKSGRKYYDLNGVQKPLMQILKENGVNWIRLRLWNDPKDPQGKWYGGGNTDKASVIEMAKQAKAAGLKVLVDFHYSDFWADPGTQTMPKAWVGLDEAALKQAVYDYTYDMVNALADNGAYPDMVQIGNEINNGMLWPLGRTPAGAKTYIERGIAAVRAVETAKGGTRIKIMIHRANPNNGAEALTSFYGNYADLDYDVIGLSFYPYWHGTFDNIKEVMNALSATFDKDVVIAETSYGFTAEDAVNNGPPGQVFNAELAEAGGYLASVTGQASAVRDVIAAVAEVPNGKGLGLFYWEPAWLPGADTGWATKYASSYSSQEIAEDGGSGWANQGMFNYFGEALPSIRVFNLVRASDESYRQPAIVEVPDVTIATGEGTNVPLPATARALMADDAYRTVPVTAWTPNAYDYNKAGTYEAVGSLQGGATVKAVITVGPKNYVVNPSIESADLSAWALQNANRSPEAASAGTYAIHFWDQASVSVKQTVTNLPNGKYRLSMHSRIGANADPIGEIYMYAAADGARKQTDLTASGWSAWNLNVIPDIEVQSGTAEIGVVVKDAFEAGGDFDEWELVRTGDLPNADTPGNPDSVQTPPDPAQQPDRKIVTNPQANAEGKIAVSIENGEKQVLLPANAAAIDGKNALLVAYKDVAVEIPGVVLAKLKSLAGGNLEGAQIALSVSALSPEQFSALLNEAKRKSGAGLTAAGETFNFELALVDKNGKSTPLRQFDTPIKLRLNVGVAANPDLLGMYYIADDGALEYVGGTLADGALEAQVGHFSAYAALEYDRSFDDVAANHWAYGAIKSLAAKHVAEGDDGALFAPEREVTRAEFAALLVRSLGLQAAGTSPFKDVDANDWYAGEITAANEAGIVKGRGGDRFAPNAPITRQEMAAMIVKAYELRAGKTASSAGAAGFADADAIDAWALPAVQAAQALGLVNGKMQGKFDPHGMATRAESAKVVALMLKR